MRSKKSKENVNTMSYPKGRYLYILYSKHFDIDRKNSLHKFGMTTKISERKFNSCYVTAFKYPCVYKRWYEIKTVCSLSQCEAKVLMALRKIEKKSSYYNENIKKCGIEMFDLPLVKMSKVVEKTLRSEGIKFIKHTEDNFKYPSYSFEDEKLPNVEVDIKKFMKLSFISNLNTKLNKGVKLNKNELKFIREQNWVFDHSECDVNNRCCLCNYPLRKKSFTIVNDDIGLGAHVGSECINKIPNIQLEYKSKIIQAKIEELTGDDPIKVIKNSTSNIKKIVTDPCQLLYDYYMQNKSSTEVSGIRIKYGEEWDIIDSLQPYDPRGLCGAIVMWMYSNNNTYITLDTLYDMIYKWNDSKNKNWNYQVLKVYLTNNNHQELRYDSEKDVVIYKKYWKLESNIKDDIIKFTELEYTGLTDFKQFSYGVENRYNEYVTYTIMKKEDGKGFDQDVIDESSKKQIYFFTKNFLTKSKQKRISILTGVAGSGKSTVSSFIAAEMSHHDYHVIQLAPTGKAVSVINKKNKELYDYVVEQNSNNNDIDYNISKLGYINRKAKTIHSCIHKLKYNRKTFIHIDECSMIDTELFNTIFQNINKFKDVIVLLTGGCEQLSPVGFGNPFSYIISKLKHRHMEMNKSLRSIGGSGQYLINSVLNNIKLNKSSTLNDLLKKCKYSDDTINIISYSDKNLIECKSNLDNRNLDYKFMTYTNKDRKKVIDILKYNKSNIKLVDIKDKIMILKNGYNEEKQMIYYNGQEIVVKGIIFNIEEKKCIIQEDVKSFRDYPIVGFLYNDGKVDIEIYFTEKHLSLPLQDLICYSDCISIHKSQGDDWDVVCIVLKNNKKSNIIDSTLIYTALTRYKKKIIIFYEDDCLDKKIMNKKISNTSFDIRLLTKKFNNKELNDIKDMLFKNLPTNNTMINGIKYKIDKCGLLDKFEYNWLLANYSKYSININYFIDIYKKYIKIQQS